MAEEKRYEDKIKAYLKDQGCYFVKYFANRNTRSGVPDILANINGYFVGIEVKASTGRPSELQVWNRDQIRKAGGISVIVYPEQFEDLKKMIDSLISDDFDTAERISYTLDKGK